MHRIRVFYDNKRGVRVTDRVFSTRLKDEDIHAIVSVRIGREPLYLAGVTGLALGLFAVQFGDLLYADEQMALLAGSAVLLAAGHSIASLTVATIFSEKTVWFRDLWTVQKVRRAIRDAKHAGASDADVPSRRRQITRAASDGAQAR